MSNESNATLTYLLPSTPFSLAYVLPLLCFSFVLTFAGTFLMLDRSRSFPPKDDYAALPGAFEKTKKRKFIWFLEGGIGGLACGYTTGLHLATLLSLLIPAKTPSALLSPKSFLAVWILVCVFTTLLAGRYRYVALVMAGISGGALASLAISVIIHPSLTPRIVLTTILASLLTFLVLFFYFIPKFHSWLLHPTLRFCTSSNGAFGLVLSIALLLQPRVDAWANAWERFWLRDGDSWGTSKEKGLSAAFCVFLAVGMGVDWALHRWLGECPDEKWDSYLSNYMANLPNQSDRAGIFEPPKTFWDRFFTKKSDKHDPILFPPSDDADLKAGATPQSPLKLGDLPMSPPGGFLKKGRTKSDKRGLQQYPNSRKRKPVKFGAVDDFSSSDDDNEDGDGDFKSSPFTAPPLSYSSSTPTLVDEPPKALRKKPTTTTTTDDPTKPLVIDYDAELAQLRKLKGANIDGGIPDYSDHESEEEDVTSISQRRQSFDPDHWSPAFMQKHRHSPGQSLSAEGARGHPLSAPTVSLPGAVPVPATPSLIRALDRIAVAHRVAFGDTSPGPSAPMPNTSGERGLDHAKQGVPPRMGRVEEEEREEEEDNARAIEHARKERAPRWEEFWREVRSKARS